MLENKYGYSLTVCQLSEDDGGGWLVEVPELPGCMTDGETLEDALSSIDDAIAAWINTATEKGKSIPQPKFRKLEDEYSGKLIIRIPKRLHRDLSIKSSEEEISLNQLISFLLAKGLYSDEKESMENVFPRNLNNINNVFKQEWANTSALLDSQLYNNPFKRRF